MTKILEMEVNYMKKTTKMAFKGLALILSAVIILTTLSMVAFPTLAEDSVTKDTLVLDAYSSLEAADGSTDVKLAQGIIGGPGDTGYAIQKTDGSNAFVSGTLVYRFTAAIKDIQFVTGFSDNEGFLGSVKFYGSSNGENWAELVTERTTGGTYWADGNAHSHVYDSVTFEEASQIRYIKLLFNKGVFDAPGIREISYSSYFNENVTFSNIRSTDNAYSIDGNASTHPERGGLRYFPGGTGSFTFAADGLQPITDFRAIVLLDNWFKQNAVVEVSSDGIAYSRVTPIVRKISDTTNPDYFDNTAWNSANYELLGSFTEEENVRLVRITLTNTIVCAAGLYRFEYNSKDITIKYMNEFDLSAGTTEADRLIAPSPAGGGGYFVTNTDGAVAEGSMIYYSEEGISDYIIEYAQVFSIFGEAKFYVSTDGTDWVSAPGADKQLSQNYAGDANCWYHQFSGTLLPSAGYKYIKVEILKGSFVSGNFPAVFYIRYNNAAQMGTENPQIADPVMKDRYEIRKSVNKTTAIQADDFPLTNVFGVGDNLWYDVYTFWDMDAWSNGDTGNAWKPGIIEYQSDDAITDYRIKGIWHGGGADRIKVYASTDGADWLELSPSIAEVGDFSNPNWGAFTSKWFYGSFKEGTDIHYIRIEMIERVVWLPFLPGMCFMDYSTVNYDGLPIRPQAYANKSVESNYFLQDDESITFKSGSTMTDYDLILKQIEGKTPVVSVSRNGSDWKPSAAVTESAGEGLLSLYDTFPAEDGYQYIKIDKTTAEFVELRYNLANGSTDTTRRHYEMPPLSEDIEDLDIDKVEMPFCEGNNNGIIAWNDLSPTMNSDQNASFIGGKYGIVGPEGEGSILITTPNVHDFKLRAAFSSDMNYIHIKAYGRKAENGEETEIPLLRVIAKDYEHCGFKNYIFRPANREAVAAAGYHYIRIEMTKEITFMDQILDFEYFYELPELIPMPDFATPENDEFEILDRFESVRLTEDEGGKAIDSCYLQREERPIGSNNPSDIIVRKTYFMAESYVIYKAPALSSFDIRAYKSAECITDLIIYVSEDNENWTEVTANTVERDIYDGFKTIAYQASQSDIGDGMNYIKIEIPDLEGSETELMLYELQLLHKSTELPVEEEEEDEFLGDDYQTESEEEPVIEEPEEVEKEETSTKPPRRKKVVKVRRKAATGLYWYEWALIIGLGSLAVVAGAITTIIIVKKRKKAQVK